MKLPLLTLVSEARAAITDDNSFRGAKKRERRREQPHPSSPTLSIYCFSPFFPSPLSPSFLFGERSRARAHVYTRNVINEHTGRELSRTVRRGRQERGRKREREKEGGNRGCTIKRGKRGMWAKIYYDARGWETTGEKEGKKGVTANGGKGKTDNDRASREGKAPARR